MSETTTYQPAPGITVRQRISVKQTAKGEYTRDYTVEITGTLAAVYIDPDVILRDGDANEASLCAINRTALRRAEADWQAHVARIQSGVRDE